MKVLGIIAEYNPFHNGHLYHLSESKKDMGADFVVAVMSGNFVQRGEPALLDKWKRAQIAVENGVDLVVELPFAFACNTAEMFAKGAVDILNGLGCVTHLSFGTEEGNLESLQWIAECISDENLRYKEVLKENLGKGSSIAASREKAICEMLGKDLSSVIRGSNNILAIEYLKQLHLTKSTIQPVTVKRKGPEYKEDLSQGDLASATFIRNQAKNKKDFHQYIPAATLKLLDEDPAYVFLNDFYSLITYNLFSRSKEELAQVYSVSEGLENRIHKMLRNSKGMDQLIQDVLSKRYTETRIKRLMIQSLMQLDKDSFNKILQDKINYARVLGISQKGALLLHHIKKNQLNGIPVITNINKELQPTDPIWKLLQLDILASDVYNLVSKGETYADSDYVRKPYHPIQIMK